MARQKSKKNNEDKSGLVRIKKYVNRRLYDTASSRYITLDHVTGLVREEIDFVVIDARTGEDITRSVLTQIIVEEESKGQSLLPIGFLRQLIRLYGDNMQWLVPSFLEQSMAGFVRNQERMQAYLHETVQGLFGFGDLEQVSRNQMSMLAHTMKLLNPFEQTLDSGEKDEEEKENEGRMLDLQARIDTMQSELMTMRAKDHIRREKSRSSSAPVKKESK